MGNCSSAMGLYVSIQVGSQRRQFTWGAKSGYKRLNEGGIGDARIKAITWHDEDDSRTEVSSSMQEIKHEPEFLGQWNSKLGAFDDEDRGSLSSASSKSKSLNPQARRASHGLGMDTRFSRSVESLKNRMRHRLSSKAEKRNSVDYQEI